MRALSAPELLSIWECGSSQPPVIKALMLLTHACPETPREELAKLSIGQRDGRLLTLREWMFGQEFIGLAICPGCNSRLEVTFNSVNIKTETGYEQKGPLYLTLDDYEVKFRLPDSNDLISLIENKDVTDGGKVLLSRCLLEIRHNSENLSVVQLPAKVADAITECMAQADPQADVQLNLDCPACGHNWSTAFDILSFFWSEIENWARRILRDIHMLASTYGWHEADILAMSAMRRQFYLNMQEGV
jgi:hypothetical protein